MRLRLSARIVVFCLATMAGLLSLAEESKSTVPATVADGAKLVEIYNDDAFFEGPAWHPGTGKLYFTRHKGKSNQVLRLDAPGKATVWLDNSEGVGGLFQDPDGGLFATVAYGHRLLHCKVTEEGPVDIKVLHHDDTLHQPNDLCRTSDGKIYFTDPDFGNKKTSAVYLYARGKVTKVIEDMAVPNGIIASGDGKTLYVSDSHRKHWRAYPIQADGNVGQGRIFFEPQTENTSDPDGMSIDEQGNVYCTGRGGVWVVNPEGKSLGLIATPIFISNVTIGGPDHKTLYLVGSGKVYSLALKVRGAPIAQRQRAAAEPAARERLQQQLADYYTPPTEFAGKLGSYRSPLRFANGQRVESLADWQRRRQEIFDLWQKRLGPWPPLVEKPEVKLQETVERDGYRQRRITVQISPEGRTVEGYLLVPQGDGPFPAVLVPFYEPLTSIGQGEKGRGTHDYGWQLVKRGFVTLSIGTPGALDKIGVDTREALIEEGEKQRRQPLTVLAYVAANCHTALAQMPEVDAERIGIIGLSYGGKWAMFASCLHERFACAVWSDPGIVFDEKNGNVNYWEPWYLGYDPTEQRKPGIPSADNPRTGLYKELIAAGDDLVDLHALMAPRPVLVSGGTEDPPRNWQALNHLIEINRVLGHEKRVAMTARQTHVPTAEALELELAFLTWWLKP
jgi:sugar lactone lactonase YvrE/dienelactone hydrolase